MPAFVPVYVVAVALYIAVVVLGGTARWVTFGVWVLVAMFDVCLMVREVSR